jgi:hypothetical protein
MPSTVEKLIFLPERIKYPVKSRNTTPKKIKINAIFVLRLLNLNAIKTTNTTNIAIIRKFTILPFLLVYIKQKLYKNLSKDLKKIQKIYLKISKMLKNPRITIIVFSVFPPGTINPLDLILRGQNGIVPSTVRVSKNK